MNTYLIGLSNGAYDNDAQVRDRTKAPFKFSEEKKPSEVSIESINLSLNIASVKIEEIDFLISASGTPDFNNPSLSQSILGKMQGVHIGGIEIRQSAAGFQFAVELAKNLIESGIHKAILIVCTEFLARAYNSMNSENITPEIEYAKSISSDAVFSCIACSEEFIKDRQINGLKFSIIDNTIHTADKLSSSFTIPFPSTSQYPERITKENVKKNQHLAQINKEEFIKDAKSVFASDYLEKIISDSRYILQHSPVSNLLSKQDFGLSEANADKHELIDITSDQGYQGSAGIGNTLIKITKQNILSDQDRITAISCGAGLNWGILKLEALK